MSWLAFLMCNCWRAVGNGECMMMIDRAACVYSQESCIYSITSQVINMMKAEKKRNKLALAHQVVGGSG